MYVVVVSFVSLSSLSSTPSPQQVQLQAPFQIQTRPSAAQAAAPSGAESQDAMCKE